MSLRSTTIYSFIHLLKSSFSIFITQSKWMKFTHLSSLYFLVELRTNLNTIQLLIVVLTNSDKYCRYRILSISLYEQTQTNRRYQDLFSLLWKMFILSWAFNYRKCYISIIIFRSYIAVDTKLFHRMRDFLFVSMIRLVSRISSLIGWPYVRWPTTSRSYSEK